jgi:hypothetical protein
MVLKKTILIPFIEYKLENTMNMIQTVKYLDMMNYEDNTTYGLQLIKIN